MSWLRTLLLWCTCTLTSWWPVAVHNHWDTSSTGWAGWVLWCSIMVHTLDIVIHDCYLMQSHNDTSQWGDACSWHIIIYTIGASIIGRCSYQQRLERFQHFLACTETHTPTKKIQVLQVFLYKSRKLWCMHVPTYLPISISFWIPISAFDNHLRASTHTSHPEITNK